MKYAPEVISLLSAYPGRQFKMVHIVNHVSPGAQGTERQRVRNGVERVLKSLSEIGQVQIVPAHTRGSGALYAWEKVPHAVIPKCQRNCHNSRRSIAS